MLYHYHIIIIIIIAIPMVTPRHHHHYYLSLLVTLLSLFKYYCYYYYCQKASQCTKQDLLKSETTVSSRISSSGVKRKRKGKKPLLKVEIGSSLINKDSTSSAFRWALHSSTKRTVSREGPVARFCIFCMAHCVECQGIFFIVDSAI